MWANLVAQNNHSNLDNYFSALSRNQQFNGNVLVAEGGIIIYENSFGFADFAQRKLNTKQSRFPIASITKTFTATAILQLKEKGKLKIDDPVTKHVPDFPYPAITIKHLLSHTSGLQPYDNYFDSLRNISPSRVFTNTDVLPRYKALRLPLLYQPGTDGNYDNSNFIFLGLIVEKVSGMSLADYIRKQILEPAGMVNTISPIFAFYHYTPKEKINLSLTYKRPHPYSDNYERTDTMQFVSMYWHSYNFRGFGEIVSTTQDLFKYDQALYNGKLLNKATLKETFIPVRLTNGSINPVGNGLGWKINKDSEFGELVSHTGGLVGIRTIFLRNITKHQTIILFDNTENDVDEIAENVLKILNGQMVKLPRKSIANIYGKILATEGIDKARATLELLQNDSLNYSLNENQFNNIGYDFMENNKESEALEVFKTNLKLFPRSWNVYDSYGEALLKYGKTEEGIKMYQKAVELNPNNLAGKKIIDQLLRIKHP